MDRGWMALVRMGTDSSALITQVRIFNLTRSLEQNRSCSVLLLMFQQRPNCLDLQMHLQLYTALEYGLFSGSTRTFVFIDIITSWANAQSYCRLHYTDLASVRNKTENQKIDDLVPPGIRVWIGLFRESWKWTDGSNSSFTYWKTNAPNNKNGPELCVAANFEQNANWEDWSCDSQKEFVCNVGKHYYLNHWLLLVTIYKLHPNVKGSCCTSAVVVAAAQYVKVTVCEKTVLYSELLAAGFTFCHPETSSGHTVYSARPTFSVVMEAASTVVFSSEV